MTGAQLTALLDKIRYKLGYSICRADGNPRTVQVRVWRRDRYTDEYGWGYGGKATIAADATPADVVRTIFGLFKALEEHECREWFTVDGVQVFSPHIEYEALIEAGRHIQGHPELQESREQPRKYATGGYIAGPGSPTNDTIVYRHDLPDGTEDHLIQADGICAACAQQVFSPAAIRRALDQRNVDHE